MSLLCRLIDDCFCCCNSNSTSQHPSSQRAEQPKMKVQPSSRHKEWCECCETARRKRTHTSIYELVCKYIHTCMCTNINGIGVVRRALTIWRLGETRTSTMSWFISAHETLQCLSLIWLLPPETIKCPVSGICSWGSHTFIQTYIYFCILLTFQIKNYINNVSASIKLLAASFVDFL